MKVYRITGYMTQLQRDEARVQKRRRVVKFCGVLIFAALATVAVYAVR